MEKAMQYVFVRLLFVAGPAWLAYLAWLLYEVTR